MLNSKEAAKKAKECSALQEAWRLSTLIPSGEIKDFEKPDFKIETRTGIVGIEVTELMPAPKVDSFSSPLAEVDWLEKLMAQAERQYIRVPGAIPVEVSAFFRKPDAGKYDKPTMVRGLIDFVLKHRHEAKPVANFSWRPDLPEGFSHIQICARAERPWHGHKETSQHLDDIKKWLGERIRIKNKAVTTYRTNIPNAPIYLLVFSCMGVSRGVFMPFKIEEVPYPFDFDRVFFYAALDSPAVVEIRKA